MTEADWSVEVESLVVGAAVSQPRCRAANGPREAVSTARVEDADEAAHAQLRSNLWRASITRSCVAWSIVE